MATDDAWADLARASRAALAHLGYEIEPQCLPDETDPCGGTFVLHTAAHLATIKAVADHHITHLGAGFEELLDDVYERATAHCRERDGGI